MKAAIALLLAIALLPGFSTSSSILVGKQRPPVDPAVVRIYTAPPAKYEEVAIIEANSKSSTAFGEQAQTDKVIERLKQQAAAVGANGVLLQGVHETGGATLGTGLGTASGSVGGSSISILGASIGLSTDLHNKAGKGKAIYVIEE